MPTVKSDSGGNHFEIRQAQGDIGRQRVERRPDLKGRDRVEVRGKQRNDRAVRRDTDGFPGMLCNDPSHGSAEPRQRLVGRLPADEPFVGAVEEDADPPLKVCRAPEVGKVRSVVLP
jgi:hypothetical protein